jgi:hypothetical protein
MINFKFYFRTTKFNIDKASLNLEKLILQKLFKSKAFKQDPTNLAQNKNLA